MLILLEGVAGTGKYDIAQDVVQEINARYPGDTVELWISGKPDVHPLHAYVTPLLFYRPSAPPRPGADGTMVRNPGHHIVCAGWHWGEAVYPAILKRPTEMTDEVIRYLQLFLASRGAYTAYLVAYEPDVQDSNENRGTDSLTPQDLDAAAVAYSRFGWQGWAKNDSYSVHQDDLVQTIVTKARALENRAHLLNGLVTYVGEPGVTTLVLGNTRNTTIGAGKAPAFMPYPNSCGEFLIGALSQIWSTAFGTAVGLANACDVDDLENLISTVAPFRVVTLGRKATHHYEDVFGADSTLYPHLSTTAHPQAARLSPLASLYAKSFLTARSPRE
jgi:hypothetical protein